jgi:hypothetical protein
MDDDKPDVFLPDGRLDEFGRTLVEDCLDKEGLSLRPACFSQFVRNIEASIAAFRAAAPEEAVRAGQGARRRKPFRDAHNALRKLWIMSHDDDPPIGELRGLIKRLPRAAVEYLDWRAPNVISRRLPHEPQVARFQDWAACADQENLIIATRVLSGEGAQNIKGRSRGGGKRSRPQVEPIVMGEVRGAGAKSHRGGRPINEGDQTLVMHLALDWLHATGAAPTPNRSDNAGFGKLVHTVFQWLERPDQSAAYALRRYWAEVEKGKPQKPLDNL